MAKRKTAEMGIQDANQQVIQFNEASEDAIELSERQRNLAKFLSVFDIGLTRLGYNFSKKEDVDEVVLILNSYLSAKLKFDNDEK